MLFNNVISIAHISRCNSTKALFLLSFLCQRKFVDERNFRGLCDFAFDVDEKLSEFSSTKCFSSFSDNDQTKKKKKTYFLFITPSEL